MMKRILVTFLLTVCGFSGALGQTPTEEQLRKECVAKLMSRRALPKGPFRFLPNESYKQSPSLKFQINQDGTVANVKLIRHSGISDLDRQAVAYVAAWKYKPRPRGCRIVESEVSIIIDFW
jgi:TonB family protein